MITLFTWKSLDYITRSLVMGKIQPPENSESKKTRKLQRTAPPPDPEKPLKSESGTQTVSSELGSFQDLREKLGGLFTAIQMAINSWEGSKHEEKTQSVGTEQGLSCPVCLLPYSPGQKPPLCLPCGHTICQQCTALQACPFDQTSFEAKSLPVNYLLLELHENLSGPVQVLCKTHDNPALGFCVTDSRLLCGLCLFSHKDHVSWALDSDQAKAFAEERKRLFEMQLEGVTAQMAVWTSSSCNLESLWGNLTMTPLAMSLNIMYGPQIYPQGSNEYSLMMISGELTRLIEACHQLTHVLRLHTDSLEKQIRVFPRLSMGEKLCPAPASIPPLPETEELLTSFGLLVGRLSFPQSYSMLCPLNLNQAF